MDIDQAIGTRIKSLREGLGLSLGELAARSGVSKAMIARVEKAESSATAALLGRLCGALGVTLSSLLASADRPSERLSRAGEQPVWQDPETGYVRRHVSPAGATSGIEIIAVELPPKVRVPYDAWQANPYAQQLVMLRGTLTLQIDRETYELREGDCLDFDVLRPLVYENRTTRIVRYLVIVRRL